MENSGQDRSAAEIERLRQALDAETEHCLEVQRQLQRANAEFEDFVSTAVHNLREPLRGVASYSQLLTEACAGSLNAEAIAFLAHIQEDVARMQSLLAGIVDYWASGASDRQPSRTDMEAVFGQALLYADKQVTERSAVVTHDPLPVVLGDFEILTKVLRHLIGNAIEYCGSPAPRVHVSSKRERGVWVISVRDNGPGIDPAFHDRVFQAFKRLHGKDYPGNGLGLAFCKRAIEWHGGRIWVESAPGQGSVFYFTLLPAE
ncbi:MAG: ATP-binding protein [Bryobacteraceae bacterium]|nr:ATP-binding protein [Bryobacteraceae bacterium]